MMIESEEAARAFVAERCSPQAFAALERFADELVAESERQNLIARSTIENLWQRHFADSAQLLDHVSRETSCAAQNQARPFPALPSGPWARAKSCGRWKSVRTS